MNRCTLPKSGAICRMTVLQVLCRPLTAAHPQPTPMKRGPAQQQLPQLNSCELDLQEMDKMMNMRVAVGKAFQMPFS